MTDSQFILSTKFEELLSQEIDDMKITHFVLSNHKEAISHIFKLSEKRTIRNLKKTFPFITDGQDIYVQRHYRFPFTLEVSNEQLFDKHSHFWRSLPKSISPYFHVGVQIDVPVDNKTRFQSVAVSDVEDDLKFYDPRLVSTLESGEKIETEIENLDDVPHFNIQLSKFLIYYNANWKDFIRFLLREVWPDEQTFDNTPVAKKIGLYLHRPHGVNIRSKVHYIMGYFKRICTKHDIDTDLFDEFSEFYKRKVDKLIPIEHFDLSREVLLSHWLDSSSYNQKEKDKFLNIFDSYEKGELIVDHETLHLKSFIKRELYPSPKFARIINSRSDLFKVLVAPYIHTIENYIYDHHYKKHHLDDWVVKRMQYMLHTFDYAYETDYSSFESSFSTQHLKLEAYFLTHMLKYNPDVAKLVEDALTIDNVIYSRAGRFIVPGTRMSGEMWTSLGNGFMNATLIDFLAYKSKCECDYIVEGDDGFASFTRCVDYSICEKLGFKLKLEQAFSINDVSFCGVRIDPLGRPTGSFEKSLIKLGIVTDSRYFGNSKRTRRLLLKLLKAKLMSYNIFFQYTPVIGKYINDRLQQLKNINPNLNSLDKWVRQNWSIADVSVEHWKCEEIMYHFDYGDNFNSTNLHEIEQELMNPKYVQYLSL